MNRNLQRLASKMKPYDDLEEKRDENKAEKNKENIEKRFLPQIRNASLHDLRMKRPFNKIN